MLIVHVQSIWQSQLEANEQEHQGKGQVDSRNAAASPRICSAGALGLLFCIICIKPIGSPLDWILRVAPGIGVLHTIYAIYHLSRSSKDRTPTSTASYMIFAAILDAGMLPFLAFMAMMAYGQHGESPATKDHWQTLFPKEAQTSIIIFAFYLTSVVDGALHLVSLIISVYLTVVFRKISKLPPDMNPLEDNLTSRKGMQHKRNKSSLSFATDSPSNRSSVQQPLMADARKVPFLHTRETSSSTMGGTPSPRADRVRYDGSPRSSRIQLNGLASPSSASLSPSAFNNNINTGSSSARASRTDLRQSPDRPAQRSSGLSSVYPSDVAHHSSPVLVGAPHSRPISTTAAHIKRSSLYHAAPKEDNWFNQTGDAGDADDADDAADHTGLALPELQHLRHSREHIPELVLSPQVRLPKPHKAGYEFLDAGSENSPPRAPIRTPVYTPAPVAPGAANPYRPALRETQVRADARPPAGSPATVDELRFLAEQRARGGSPASYRRNDGSDFLGASEDVGRISAQSKRRFYGSLRGLVGGRRKAERAVSTGLDNGAGASNELRGREVSGKVVEEGRA